MVQFCFCALPFLPSVETNPMDIKCFVRGTQGNMVNRGVLAREQDRAHHGEGACLFWSLFCF
jgi:hypothetical protein